MDKKEAESLIFYEIYPTSFYDSNGDGIGDFKGIEEKLPYVKELGCNAIWLNPSYLSPFHDGGYDVKDYREMDPRFGTMEDFLSLLQTAHSLGIKIMLDLVAGHMSEENAEFLRSAEPERNECSDLFIWNDGIWNWESDLRVEAGRHPRDGSYMVNFFAFQPALNYGFYEKPKPWMMDYKDPRTFLAREYVLDWMRFYLSKGVDGFRVDMADSLVKKDDEKIATIEVWQYLFSKIRKEYPNAYFVSEWSNPDRAFRAGFDADFVLDHSGNFFALFAKRGLDGAPCVLQGGPIEPFLQDLSWRLEMAKKHGGCLAPISGNHDTRRIATDLTEEQLRTFYLFLYSLPGNPFLYYGDELTMPHQDIPSKDGGFQRTGDRTPMQWDETKNHGFSNADVTYLPTGKDHLNAEDAKADPNSLYHYIKDLIAFRKGNEDLLHGETSLEECDGVITLRRGSLKAVFNFSKRCIAVENAVFLSGKGSVLHPGEAAICR